MVSARESQAAACPKRPFRTDKILSAVTPIHCLAAADEEALHLQCRVDKFLSACIAK